MSCIKRGPDPRVTSAVFRSTGSGIGPNFLRTENSVKLMPEAIVLTFVVFVAKAPGS